MEERIKLAEEVITYVMKFDLRMACVKSREYLRKFSDQKGK